jgi:cellular nucleic acid-binding protein
MAKDTQPLNTTCELCDRTFPTKDWIGHKNGKAHQQREKAEHSKENNKAAAANGDAFGFTVDADFVANGVGGDAGASSSGAWDSTLGDTGASWGDSGLSVSNNFSNGGGTRGGRAQGGGPGACYGCGEVGHNKRDCTSSLTSVIM